MEQWTNVDGGEGGAKNRATAYQQQQQQQQAMVLPADSSLAGLLVAAKRAASAHEYQRASYLYSHAIKVADKGLGKNGVEMASLLGEAAAVERQARNHDRAFELCVYPPPAPLGCVFLIVLTPIRVVSPVACGVHTLY
jgi:hypothetical protein